MPASPYARYRDTAIQSATPAQLVTMLYDRLLLDLRTAHTALTTSQDAEATYRLGHAGEIVAALADSLDVSKWDGANDLLGLYLYVTQGIISATASRNPDTITECITLLEPLQKSWHEAAAFLARQPEWDVPATAGADQAVFAVA
ncbi:flagellar export chaperone FliS [Curtobacterium sp. MCSS17_016]|uniref:flagellar export chaperone FliS n=1 Tax=Curtobacterium sp. MCSS17_016 TaxID=2175644 RepID=UPI000DA8BAD7|nr:flagellar export chaperone FliS [Curtobacterium sp. MCSS17_016]WIE80918.1 flagellar protein FliS [Curtobacterium sp. MCSS17_016]